MREIDNRLSNVEGDIKAINTRLDSWVKLFAMAINSVNKRIDDLQHNQSKNLALWGFVITIIMGAIQVAVALWLK